MSRRRQWPEEPERDSLDQPSPNDQGTAPFREAEQPRYLAVTSDKSRRHVISRRSRRIRRIAEEGSRRWQQLLHGRGALLVKKPEQVLPRPVSGVSFGTFLSLERAVRKPTRRSLVSSDSALYMAGQATIGYAAIKPVASPRPTVAVERTSKSAVESCVACQGPVWWCQSPHHANGSLGDPEDGSSRTARARTRPEQEA